MELFFYTKIGSIISIGDLPTTNIIEPLILSHRIFRDLFGEIIETGMIPDKGRVVELELEYNVCSIDVASRRATSVIGWLNWIFNLVNI